MIKTRTTFRRLLIGFIALVGDHWLVWAVVAALAAGIHGGTALLRLSTFYPSPQLLDFASYYAGAWSLRLGLSGVDQWQTVVSHLAANEQLSMTPAPPYGPVLWQILLLPATLLAYPAAATLWLALLVALCAWAHGEMMRIAGYSRPRHVWLTLPLTLTFGPAFLNLTLGQSAPVLLVSALLLGSALEHRRATGKPALGPGPASVIWVAAVAAKLFPAVWLAPWLLAKRWRESAIALLICLAAFGAAHLANPVADRAYWEELLPGRALGHATSPGIDDQSLSGFLGRLSRPAAYQVPGLSVDERKEIVWEIPWELPARTTTAVSFAALGILGVVTLVYVRRSSVSCPMRAIGLIVLYSLMLVPHMERYNHILVLPAMAFLWGQSQRGRHIAIAAYGLFALSRLGHVLVQVPFPFGPLFSGFGLLGVLLLWVGLIRSESKAMVEPLSS